jgi:hypothetical protein
LNLAKHAVSGPFATTRKQLLKAVTITMVCVCVLAGGIGVKAGVHIFLDMVLGAIVVLAPSGWMVLSLTSERSAVSPVWLGVARYGLAAVGFAALFAIRPTSDPLAVLAGSAVALFLPSALIANNKWSGQHGGSSQ